MAEFSSQAKKQIDKGEQIYQFLQPSQIEMIDEALSSVGDFGEVRLIVEKGHLRFLVTQRSFDTLKWQPGCISPSGR
jgi:hypothetical protein